MPSQTATFSGSEVAPSERVADSPPVNLRERCRLPELMDAPDLPSDQHQAALAGLRRVNLFSRSTAILWPSLKRLAADNPTQPLRVLDIASGGGDVIAGLAKKAHRNGLDLQIDGCDISQTAIEYAREFTERNSPLNHQFFCINALQEGLPEDYDIVMCSLFLHHLEEPDAIKLLTQMSTAARRAVLVNDLRRTRFGYALAVVGCRLLTRSPIVHVDGPLSVRAAWSDEEVRDLADRSGMKSIELTHHWPERFLLSWRKS